MSNMTRLLLSIATWLALSAPAPAAISYNWTTNAYNHTTATSVTTTKGANAINSGDLLLVVAGVSGTADPGTITPPAGFTLAQPNGIAGTFYTDTNYNLRYAIFCKIADASETGDYTFSWTNSGVNSWVMLDYSGTASACASVFDGGSERDVFSGSFTSSLAISTAVVTSNANDVLISLWMLRASGTMTLPANARTAYNPSSSSAPWIGASDLSIPTAGSQAVQTDTYSTTTANYSAVAFGIKAASGGGAVTPRGMLMGISP